MRLTSKLLGWLSQAFDPDPVAFLGLRITYDGSMAWTVADGWLTTSIQGGSGRVLSIDLAAHTVRSLAGFVSAQQGYATPFVAAAGDADASALRLLEGSGDQGVSNGDHLYAYTSPLYAHLDAVAVEMDAAERAIRALPDELATTTADGGWLDYLGSYYGVTRLAAETDGSYSLRIVTETLRPLGNNLAIEQAIADYTGQQVSIIDVVEYNAPQPRFDGTPKWDGTYNFLPSAQPIYGLFDCLVGYDILGGDPPATESARLRAIINRLRDAGTQLRAIALAESTLQDTAPGVPADDADTLVITYRRRFDGAFAFDGSIPFAGPLRLEGTIAGKAVAVPIVNTVATLTIAGGPVLTAAGPVTFTYDAAAVAAS